MSIVIEVFRPCSPADASGLLDCLRLLPVDRIRRLMVLGKTEGPATLNDFSRELAQCAVDEVIRKVGGPALLARTTRLFSTGVEGIASPVMVLLAETENAVAIPPGIGLAFGAAISAPVPDAQRGALAHVETARETVARAIEDAGLVADQVSLVLIKSPILSAVEATRQGGERLRHGGSTASSRGAAAIGAGLALGEIDPKSLGNDPVGRTSVHAQRVMAFSGTEVDCLEALVIGKRPGGDPRWDIKSALVEDLADGDAMRGMRPGDDHELVLVLLKAGISTDGQLRGRRTTILTSELPADKQLRAAASGVVAACFGVVNAFISAGAEHQGPPGACLCTLILKTRSAAL